jgi:hypothetical protein
MNVLQRIVKKVTEKRTWLIHEYSITEELIPAKPPEIWEVRWMRYKNEYMPNLKEEVEVLTSTEQAEAFVKSLKYSFELTRHKHLSSYVTMKKLS